jgi:hypothetical protein
MTVCDLKTNENFKHPGVCQDVKNVTGVPKPC